MINLSLIFTVLVVLCIYAFFFCFVFILPIWWVCMLDNSFKCHYFKIGLFIAIIAVLGYSYHDTYSYLYNADEELTYLVKENMFAMEYLRERFFDKVMDIVSIASCILLIFYIVSGIIMWKRTWKQKWKQKREQIKKQKFSVKKSVKKFARIITNIVIYISIGIIYTIIVIIILN